MNEIDYSRIPGLVNLVVEVNKGTKNFQNVETLKQLYTTRYRSSSRGSVISNYENNIKIPTLDVLTTMARIYNVSLDYLVGFDKKDQVILEGMTDGQRELIHRLVKELKESTKPKNGGLSADQQEILNLIMQEFSK